MLLSSIITLLFFLQSTQSRGQVVSSQPVAVTKIYRKVYEDHGWASTRQLVVFTMRDGRPKAELVDIITKKRTPLNGLNAQFAKHPKHIKRGMFISPDGKYVMWQEADDYPLPATLTVVSSLDGTERVEFFDRYLTMLPISGRTIAAWLPGTRKWITAIWTRVWIFDLDKPQTAEDLIVKGRQGNPDSFANLEAPKGILPNGHALAAFWQSPEENFISLVEFGITRPSPVAHEYRINVPVNGYVTDLQLSPDGKYLAWLILYVAGKTAPQGNAIDSDRMSLIVSKTDGSEWQQLHFFISGNETQGWRFSLPKDLNWLPGGKQLSYALKDTIYVLPVQ
jgi:hypothetical protein